MSQPPLITAIDKHQVAIEPLLRDILARVEADDAFREDLDALNFQPWPSTADEIDCRNPWFFVIAMNGGGSAFGLYLHPTATADRGGGGGRDGGDPKPAAAPHPWVFWEHEEDTLCFLAANTDRFFRGWLKEVAAWTKEPDVLARAKAVLAELGVAVDSRETVTLDFDAEPGAPWLPPVGRDVAPLSTYLDMLKTTAAAADGNAGAAAAERGLLAHATERGSIEAEEALDALWKRQGRTPPREFDL